jgi:hypothetical protein
MRREETTSRGRPRALVARGSCAYGPVAHRALAHGLVVSCMLFAAESSAAQAPVTVEGGASTYERDTLASALARVGGEVEPEPTGKVIESIELELLEPIEPRDPAPAALNALHVASRSQVIVREVLVRVGQRYEQALVDETARNLRRLPQLSLVLCVPLRGSAQDRVRLLVVTKDVWSLFVDVDVSVTNGGIERLVLRPRESNVGGLHTTAFARFQLEPASYSLGGGYVAPRVEGRRLALALDGNVIVHRETRRPEGAYGTVSATRPLFSTRSAWAWLIGATFRDEVFRRYVNASVATLGDVPWQYRVRAFSQQLAATRSLGWRNKNDLSVGFELTHRRYASAEPSVRAVMPTGERRVGPYVEWHAHSADFLRTIDVERLGLQEDIGLGHEVRVRAYVVATGLGATRSFVGARAAAQYTLPLGDGFVRAGFASVTEAERTRVSDASLDVFLRIVSPRTGLGRLLFDGRVLDRYRNHLGALSFVGGEGRLRGYPTRAFAGSHVVALNLELRSRSFDVGSVQFGLGFFYDVADAFDAFRYLTLRHAVGAGVRMVLPQFDRSVVRVDVGVPIERGAPAVFVGFNHAFPLGSIAPPAPSPTPTIGGALGP